MSETVEYVLLISSFILSGFYSGSEAALVSIPVDRLKRLMEEDENKREAFEFLLNRSHSVMNTILVGNNLVNIFAASMTTKIASRHFADDALAISVGVTTALILVFGEITPKTFARAQAERLAVPIIKLLRINYFLFFPVVKTLTYVIKRLLGKNAHLRGNLVTKDDIEYLVNKAAYDKTIDSKQVDLLNSILEFPKIKVKDIMVSRNKVVAMKDTVTFKEVISLVRENGHSRYPVFQEDLDTVNGFLHVKDLAFVGRDEEEKFDVKKYLKPPFFIYEHMKIQAVFDHMNRRKVHLALVKDENGIVVGIITLEDIMEEIFGEIVDEHDVHEDTVEGQQPQQNGQDGIIVAGTISLRDLDNTYGIEIPLNDNYSTLTGFLLETLGDNFPAKGQIILWENHSFEIKKIEDHLIKEVLIRKVKIEEDQTEDESASEDAKVINLQASPAEDQ